MSDRPADLLPEVYDELRGLARGYMARERPGHTLQPTALVHEAYARVEAQSRVQWQGRNHFIAVAATAMRRVLVDHARARDRHKRGAGWERVTLSAAVDGSAELEPERLLDLDVAAEMSRFTSRQILVQAGVAMLAQANETPANLLRLFQ